MERKATVVFGLGFGDEGKGTMTDYLARRTQATLVVRTGGAQAAHHVVLADGRHHNFAQFGSASLIPGVRTILSQYMLWDPISLIAEARVLSEKIGCEALDFHMVDERARLVTPFHVAANQISEWMRGSGKHGSVGKGIGETMHDVVHYPNDVPMACDLSDVQVNAARYARIQERKRSWLEQCGVIWKDVPLELSDCVRLLCGVREPKKVAQAHATITKYLNIIAPEVVTRMMRNTNFVIEGSQGVLLDEWHGFHPHTTWVTTVPRHAMQLLQEVHFDGEVETVGVLRTVMSRHGAGPFPTENKEAEIFFANDHNGFNPWQEGLRAGWFDLVLAEYACRVAEHYAPLNSIALTYADAFLGKVPVWMGTAYAHPTTGARADLLPQFNNDLSAQADVAKLLEKVNVTYELADCLAALMLRIQERTRAPVNYLSAGNTPQDKICL